MKQPQRILCALLTLMLTIATLTGPLRALADAPVEIDMFITAPEYTDAIRALIDEYQKIHPEVDIRYEATQSDYPALLKTRINAGQCPDIFATTAGKEVLLYQDYSYDLTGTPAADALTDAARTVMSVGDEVYGFHYVCNYFGIIYNQEMFENCGINAFPETLTELEAACRKLSDAGYQPFSTGFSEWWVFKHIFQHFLNAASDDPAALVHDFVTGRAKLSQYPALYDNFFSLIDLAVRYGDPLPLETGMADEERLLASDKVAMILGQGAWVETELLALNPNLRIGFAGYPVSEDPAQCQVISGPDQALHIYRDSPALAQVLDFVNWWLTSDYGKSWFCDVCHVIPPVRDAKVPATVIATQGMALIAEHGGGVVSISYSTDAFHQVFGQIMQDYVGGSLTRAQACTAIEEAWRTLEDEN